MIKTLVHFQPPRGCVALSRDYCSPGGAAPSLGLRSESAEIQNQMRFNSKSAYSAPSFYYPQSAIDFSQCLNISQDTIPM